MKNLFLYAIVLFLCFSLTCCDQDAKHEDHKAETKEEKHAHNHEHQHGGTAQKLGTLVMEGVNIAITQSGDIKSEICLGLQLENVKTAPKAIRAWIGLEDAKGSLKGLASRVCEEDYDYDVHIEAPKVLPEGSKIWIEIEKNEGMIWKGSVDLP
ncbi:MAG: hypothetical protein HUU50_18480 [Candidatus Brocadiae bacterium]|nr:hypothetical protein [Candidatus Brocadiia bacterium]